MKNFITYKECKSLCKSFFNLYLFILGITWISMHIYVRLFLKRSSYTLVELKPHLTTTHYIIFISFIIFHVFLVYIVGIQLYKDFFRKESHPIVIKLSEKLNYLLNLIYWKPLQYIHDLLIPKYLNLVIFDYI